MSNTPGYQIKVHSSLTQPLLMGGAPRQFTILNSTIWAALLLGMQSIWAIPCWIILHFGAVMLTKKDPYFFQVILRHIRQKIFYKI